MAQLHLEAKDRKLVHACVQEPAKARESFADPQDALRARKEKRPPREIVLEPGDWWCADARVRGHEWTQEEQLEQILYPAGGVDALLDSEDNLFGGHTWSEIRKSVHQGDGAVWKAAWISGTNWDKAKVLEWLRAKPDDDYHAGFTLEEIKRVLH